jgi:thioredoxin-related protein
MKFERYFRAATLAATLALGTAFAADEAWISDFEAAKKQAADGKKSLILDFTGSDWCGWCIKLDKEVFAHEAFKTGVKDKFVLVSLDYPKDKSKVTEAVAAQNATLKNTYAIKGYPTILLTDEQGKPFAKTGYRPGGPETYVKHLDELLAVREKRDAAFAEAAKATGVEKAKALVSAIQSMPLDDEMVSKFYAEQIEAIKTADPKDESGYIKGVELKTKFAGFQKQINELASKQNFEGIMTLIDETLAAGTYEDDLKQETMIFKAITFMQLKKPEDAIKTLDEAKAVNPESRVSAHIDSMKKRFEAVNPK